LFALQFLDLSGKFFDGFDEKRNQTIIMNCQVLLINRGRHNNFRQDSLNFLCRDADFRLDLVAKSLRNLIGFIVEPIERFNLG